MDRRRHDKGIPASGLLAQVAIAKVDDHLALYRQTEIYAGSGVHIPCSSMSQWLGICGVLDLDLDQLRLSLPSQPPSKITAAQAKQAMSDVAS